MTYVSQTAFLRPLPPRYGVVVYKIYLERKWIRAPAGIYKTKDYKIIFDVQQKMIAELTKQIDKINTEMKSIIDDSSSLKQTYKLTNLLQVLKVLACKQLLL